MSETLEELGAIERQEWASRGPAWDKWSDQMAALAARMNQPLLDAAELAPGQQVLDLASGAGEPALTIAGLVAPGTVTATDLVPEMLAGAKRRAAGIGNLRFEIADMAALPFAAATFDRITCRFGLMFPPDPLAALRECLRVLKPGGLAAFMVWGPLENNSNFVAIDGAAKRVLGRSFFDRPIHPLRFAAAGTAAALMREAGFADVQESEQRFAPKIAAGVPFWAPNVEMTLGNLLADLDAAKRAELDAAIAAGFAAYLQGSHYHLNSHVRIVVGRKAS